jgi:hypothetical protein
MKKALVLLLLVSCFFAQAQKTSPVDDRARHFVTNIFWSDESKGFALPENI